MNGCRSFLLGWSAALAVTVLAAGGAWADQLIGIVRSVDPEGGKFVVIQQVTDDKVDLAVTPQTVILTASGRPIAIKNLRKGDGVGIMYVGGVATSITVNQGPLLGVVEKLDLDDRSFVVDEKGTGHHIKVSLSPNTAIETVNGKAYALKNLKTGDGVGVRYDGTDVTKVTVNTKPDELSGHVKSVGADLKSLVITELGSKADVTVGVNSDTTIVTSSGKTMELKDLKKGDGVGIAHDASMASKIVVDPASTR